MNLETTGTVSPPEPPQLPQTPPPPAPRHPVRVALVGALVIVALVAAWFFAPWRGAFGLSLPVSGGITQEFCRQLATSPTQYTVGVVTFAATDAEGVSLENISLAPGASNLRIVDARVFLPAADGGLAFGGEAYPPVTSDVVTTDQWDALPAVAGYRVTSKGAPAGQDVQIVVGVEVIDPSRAAQTAGFVLRYHQYLRSFTPDTGVLVQISAPGESCDSTQ